MANGLPKMDKSIEEAVDFLRHYMNTYDNQSCWMEYEPETYVNDILYGLGVSMSDDFKWGQGYDKFLLELRSYIDGKIDARNKERMDRNNEFTQGRLG
jgi:hypothetical protein